MSSRAVPVSQVESVASPLVGTYIRVSIWYLTLVAVCWALGIEAIHGHLTPFYALIYPAFGADAGSSAEVALRICALVGSIAVLGLAYAGLDRFILRPGIIVGGPVLSPRQLAVLVVFAAAFPAAVAMIRGPDAIAHAYSRSAYEYINDVGVGGSIRGLFHDYEKYHAHLSMHSKVHPPGPVAILWLLSFVVGRTPMGLSIATILFGALSVIPMYYWARDMLGPRRGFLATLLYVVAPTIVLFTATSADIAFMPFTITSLFLFWRAIHPNRSAAVPAATQDLTSATRRTLASSTLYALAAGIAYGLLGLISYSLLSIAAFFAFVGLWRLPDARYRGAVVRTAVVMLAAAVGLHYLVFLWSGYNSIDVFLLSKQQFDTDQANLDALDPRFAAIWWRFINPLCWFFFAGIPVSVLAVGCFANAALRRNALVWIAGLSLLVFDILYLARGEGERSAMYIVPFLVLPAACRLDSLIAAAGTWRPLTATLAFLGLQCIAIECVLYTYW